MPPAVEGRNAQRQIILVPEPPQRDVMAHEAEIPGPQMAFAEPVKRRAGCGAERRLAVLAFEPLGSSLGATPPLNLGLATAQTGLGVGCPAFQSDIGRLLRHKVMAESDNPFRWFDSSPEAIRLVLHPAGAARRRARVLNGDLEVPFSGAGPEFRMERTA